MILPDFAIEKLCQPTTKVPVDNDLLLSNPPQRRTKEIAQVPMVDPYRPEQLQPASYDVRLHDRFMISEPHDEGYIDLDDPKDITKYVQRDRFVLHPGEFVLGVTEEVVHMPDNVVARIEGKSSIGRLGLAIHVTAGFIDPGFNGRVTLEMVNLNKLPIILRAGKLVAQLSFQYMSDPARKPYEGRYQGDMDVTASRYS